MTPMSLKSIQIWSCSAALDLPNPEFDTLPLALPNLDQVQTLSLNGTFSHLEQLLLLGRSYYDGIFGDPEWRSKETTFELGPLEIFYRRMWDGQILLEQECIAEAFGQFDSTCGQIRMILKPQPFLFLPYLYHMNMRLSGVAIRTIEVQSCLLRFISSMAESNSPRPCPLKRSLSLLRDLPVDERCESSRRALKAF